MDSALSSGQSTQNRDCILYSYVLTSVVIVITDITFRLELNYRNKTSTEGRPDVNDDDSSPTGGFDTSMALLAVSSAIRPGKKKHFNKLLFVVCVSFVLRAFAAVS